MIDFIAQFFLDIAKSFADPSKRVSLFYLFSAYLIALIWLTAFSRKSSIKENLHFIFSPSQWWSSSAKMDYLIFIVNRVITLGLSPHLLTQLSIATVLFYWLHDALGTHHLAFSSIPNWLISISFTLTFFILDDFSRYFVHKLMHKIPLLWEFHKIHHSAETLTPMTVFRTHPIEGIIFSLRTVFVQAVMIASFVFFVGDQADFITVLGANLFIFLFNLFGSNLRHSHIPMYYWKPLEKIFLSPAQHQIHHSIDPKHWNKNYGVALALWDYLGGSHHHSEKKQALTFGLSIEEHRNFNHHSLYAVYVLPFINCYVLASKYVTNFIQMRHKKHEKESEEKLSYE